jgi:glyoxylase I family protein
MTSPISSGSIHHIALTVTDVQRSEAFYTGILGFQKVMDFGPRAFVTNGSLVVALTPPPDPDQALPDDRFNENRVGLDHVSFMVDSRADLERAAEHLDEQGVTRGEIKDLGPDLGIYVMAVRDPDNIQLELTAPHS